MYSDKEMTVFFGSAASPVSPVLQYLPETKQHGAEDCSPGQDQKDKSSYCETGVHGLNYPLFACFRS
jgi:hypothetical protein